MRIVIVSSCPPRRCGISNYTSQFGTALRRRGAEVDYIEITGDEIARTPGVIRRDVLSDYDEEARRVDAGVVDLVVVQHEYGLFGGGHGSHLLAFLGRVRCPTVTVLHTVLPRPSPAVRQVTVAIAACSAGVVVMCSTAARVLAADYAVSAPCVRVISHGYPEAGKQPVPVEMAPHKAHGPVMVSLGLLGPNKGIDLGIRAFAVIGETFPTARYLVVGETHPGELKGGVDRYRRDLKMVAGELGVVDAVDFIDRYLTIEEHIAWIQHADVVMLPHQDLRQVSSGTLAYAVGHQRPVVATPFAYARDMHSAGAGIVLARSDPREFAGAVIDILGDVELRHELERGSAKLAATTSWSAIADEFARSVAEFC